MNGKTIPGLGGPAGPAGVQPEGAAAATKASAYSDPTYNVLLLVEAAVKRLDDLQTSELRRIDAVQALHFAYTEKLNTAESKRIDAIRAVDVGAVAIASERAAQQALVLANQVSTSAETLRTLVASTATSVAQQLATGLGALAERLSALEKGSYTIEGRAGTPPPWAQPLIETVAGLKQGRDFGQGKGEGMAKFVGWVVAALTILFGIAMPLILHFLNATAPIAK